MDRLTFVAQIVKSTAWPLAVICIVIVFRIPLSEILRLVKRLKYGNFEAEFDKEVKEAKEVAEEEFPQPFALELQKKGELSIYFDLIKVNPRSAVLEAWRTVESELGNLARKKALVSGPTLSSSQVLRTLDRAKALDVAQVALIHDLRALRNQAAHLEDFSPSEEAALNYVQMALTIREGIRGKLI